MAGKLAFWQKPETTGGDLNQTPNMEIKSEKEVDITHFYDFNLQGKIRLLSHFFRQPNAATAAYLRYFFFSPTSRLLLDVSSSLGVIRSTTNLLDTVGLAWQVGFGGG